MKKYTLILDCNISIPIEKYIYNKIKMMTKEYAVDNISEFGTIYLAENEIDLLNYSDIGFIKPIKENLCEYLQYTGINSIQGNKYLECCFIFSDGYGVIIIFEDKYLSEVCKN